MQLRWTAISFLLQWVMMSQNIVWHTRCNCYKMLRRRHVRCIWLTPQSGWIISIKVQISNMKYVVLALIGASLVKLPIYVTPWCTSCHPASLVVTTIVIAQTPFVILVLLLCYRWVFAAEKYSLFNCCDAMITCADTKVTCKWQRLLYVLMPPWNSAEALDDNGTEVNTS